MTLATDVALAPVLLAAIALAAGARPAADLVVTNARVWTGDPARPEAEALAVIGERIVAVGVAAEIEAWRGPATAVIDAAAGASCPASTTRTSTSSTASAKLAQVKLKDARSPEEFARRIAEHARSAARGEWVLGGDWDDQASTPAAADAAGRRRAHAGRRPVFVDRYDGHMALANGARPEARGDHRARPRTRPAARSCATRGASRPAS